MTNEAFAKLEQEIEDLELEMYEMTRKGHIEGFPWDCNPTEWKELRTKLHKLQGFKALALFQDKHGYE